MKTPTRWSRYDYIRVTLQLWEIVYAALRIYAWDSLKHGLINTRTLPRVPRWIVRLSLLFVAFFLLSILFADMLRGLGALEALYEASSASRALFAPQSAVPLTFFAIVLGWSMLLTGALHVYGWVRWGVFLTFLLFGASGWFYGTAQILTQLDPLLPVISTVLILFCLLSLLLLFLIIPRTRAHLVLEFALVLTCVSIPFLMNWLLAAVLTKSSGTDYVNGYLIGNLVLQMRLLIIPFVFISGAGMTGFAIAASGWAAKSVQRYAMASVAYGLLFLFFAWRALDFIFNVILPGITTHQAQAWAGAALISVIFIPLAWWRQHQAASDNVPDRLIVSLILLLLLFQLLLLPLLSIAAIGVVSMAQSVQDLGAFNQLADSVIAASALYRSLFNLLVAIAGIFVALVALRRKRYSVAVYGILLAWTEALWWLMEPGRPLEALRYQYADVNVWLTLALLALTLWWLARGTLTRARAVTLLALGIFGWLMAQTDFIDNPFAILLASAGVFFLVFSMAWGVLTAGGRFANKDSARFPRVNRVLLYLGYALISVSVAHWYVVTHNIEQSILTSEFNLSGFRIFGLPLAYLVFVEGGRALLGRED